MDESSENLHEIAIYKFVKRGLVRYTLASRLQVSFGQQEHVLSA